MKKIIYSLIMVSGLSLGLIAQEEDPDTTTMCTVSSNAQANFGHCRPDSEGYDNCFRTGTGPACNGDIIIPI